MLHNENYSQTDISKIICRDKSVINKELKRNSDKRSNAYKADLAQRKCKQQHKKSLNKLGLQKQLKIL